MKIKHSVYNLERASEKSFRNAIVYAEDGFKYADFGFGEFNNMTGGAVRAQPALVGRLDPTESALSVVITNTTSAAVSVNLFNVGGGQTTGRASGLSPSFGPGVAVTSPQSTYGQVLISLLSKVYSIKGLKYTCQDSTQLSNSFLVGYANERGVYKRFPYTPLSKGNNMQSIRTEIDDDEFEMNIGVDSFITILVNGTAVVSGGENIELSFTVAKINAPAKKLSGEPTLEVNPVGYQSGIPPQTLVVSNATPAAGIALNKTISRYKILQRG